MYRTVRRFTCASLTVETEALRLDLRHRASRPRRQGPRLDRPEGARRHGPHRLRIEVAGDHDRHVVRRIPASMEALRLLDRQASIVSGEPTTARPRG